MRRGVVAGVVTLGLALVVVPALAADDKTLQARDYFFEPSEVTIEVGDTVTFTIDPNSVSFHNFQFADGPKYPPAPSAPGPDWNGQSRTFTAAGTYGFVCGLHGTMTGVVNVQAPSGSPSPTPSSTPTPTGDPPPPEVRKLRMAASSFCTKPSRRCHRPGVKVQIDLSQPAAVTGALKRRPPYGRKRARSFGTVDFGTVAAGPRTLRFIKNAAGRRLTAGRYALRLRVAGEPQGALRFRVR